MMRSSVEHEVGASLDDVPPHLTSVERHTWRCIADDERVLLTLEEATGALADALECLSAARQRALDAEAERDRLREALRADRCKCHACVRYALGDAPLPSSTAGASGPASGSPGAVKPSPAVASPSEGEGTNK